MELELIAAITVALFSFGALGIVRHYHHRISRMHEDWLELNARATDQLAELEATRRRLRELEDVRDAAQSDLRQYANLRRLREAAAKVKG